MSTITIKIEIIDPEGRVSKTFEDNINSSMLISELKRKWTDKFGDVQSVRFNNEILTDDKNSNFYGIRTGSTVQLFMDKLGDQIKVIVEVQSINPNQTPFHIQVSPDIKTGELMRMIKNKILFNFDSAYLSHHGQPLKEGESLRQRNVKNNDTIHLSVRTKGGLRIHN